MAEESKTELVYKDLYQLYNEINQCRRNPRLFRLAFEGYVFKSQQLTEAMRTEYKEKTGLTWTASNFNGWNTFTSAIKKIRNAAAHGYPIELDKAMLSIYPNVPFKIDNDENNMGSIIRNKYRAMISRSFVTDSFSEQYNPIGCGFTRKDMVTSNLSELENYAFPIKNFAYYELRWHVLKVSVLTDSDGDMVDVVRLVLKSFPLYTKYMDFFIRELDKNAYDWYKSDYWIQSSNGARPSINPKYIKNDTVSIKYVENIDDDATMKVADYMYIPKH